jgi:hypothetical protein
MRSGTLAQRSGAVMLLRRRLHIAWQRCGLQRTTTGYEFSLRINYLRVLSTMSTGYQLQYDLVTFGYQ